MADWKDVSEEQMLTKLVTGYDCIALVCSLLPLPIALPPVKNGADLGDLIDGVARVSQISDELPIVPETVIASLFTSCTYWLTGAHMFMTLMAEPKEYKFDGFAMCLLGSRDSLAEAVDWLADNQE
ncbi:hypothetical protein [Streptomyces sp. NPDC002537]